MKTKTMEQLNFEAGHCVETNVSSLQHKDRITMNTIIIDWDGSVVLSNVDGIEIGEEYNIIDFNKNYQGLGIITERDEDLVWYNPKGEN